MRGVRRGLAIAVAQGLITPLGACAGAAPDGELGAAVGSSPVVTTYRPSDEPMRNPERGLLQFVELNVPNDIEFVVRLGVSLANARVRLDSFRDRPLDGVFLRELEAGFDRIRRAGLKLVLRFQYNNGSGEDPSLEQVLAHIDQLSPILARHADIIAVMQAGFIGAWGEWHTSISGLTDQKARALVLTRLLAALPRGRSVQVRSPAFKEEAFPGGPITEEIAHGGTPASRIGHHNDCFLSSATDHGTYPKPVERWRTYLAADSHFVPVGGETCAQNPPLSDCDSALRQLREYHWSYLNRAYHPGVLEDWQRQGCMDVIARDLGYRLVLHRASWPASVGRGGSFTIGLTLENRGFAAPFNPRPVVVVIGEGEDRLELELAELDWRDWSPGQTHELTATVHVPEDAADGSQPVSLWLPDAAPMLRPYPAYAVRLSNEDLWRPTQGDNLLGRITIR
jgi:hypothetical protein